MPIFLTRFLNLLNNFIPQAQPIFNSINADEYTQPDDLATVLALYLVMNFIAVVSADAREPDATIKFFSDYEFATNP